MTFELTIVTAISAMIALILSTVAITFNYQNQKKQSKILVLFKIFELLNSEEQVHARRTIFKEYCMIHPKGKKQEGEGKLIFSENTTKLASKVRIALSEINIMMDEKIIDERLFLKLKSDVIIRIWKAMEDHTKEKEIYNLQATKNFNDLFTKASNYYKKSINVVLPEPYCKKDLNLSS